MSTLCLDQTGLLAVNDGIVHYLTDCHRASAKGSGNSPTGVICRACYRPVATELAGAWLADDTAAWDRWESAFRAYNVALNAENATSPVLTSLIAAVRAQGEVRS